MFSKVFILIIDHDEIWYFGKSNDETSHLESLAVCSLNSNSFRTTEGKFHLKPLMRR